MFIEDCDSCQGPRPTGKVCPHCSAPPPRRSLQFILLGLLLGAACCKMPVVLYGIAPCDPEAPPSDGYACTCKDGGIYYCYEQCDPASYSTFHAGFACRCNNAGICQDYAVDAGTDGG